MAAYNYITANGVILPDTSAIKAEVEAEYKEIYGADFVVDTSSGQGREIDAEITSRISVVRNNALLANQQNPNLAEGIFFDAVYALMGGQRTAATRSTVNLDIGGVAGTIIPTNSTAIDDNGELWFLPEQVVISGGGTISASFKSLNYGAIAAGIGEINTIDSDVLGWETVNNPLSAATGSDEQSVQSAKRARKLELGRNSKSNAYSILAEISATPGVIGVAYRENTESTTQVIDGVTMKPHSNYVCVDGGLDSDIAKAYQIKSGGSGYNGSVSYDYTDPDSGQVIPVLFDRPTEKPIICRVTARVSSSLNAVEDIKDAVIAYANGEVSDELGFYLGEEISPFEIGSAVNISLPSTFVAKCEIALKADGEISYATNTIPMQIFEKGSIIRGDVEVVIL